MAFDPSRPGEHAALLALYCRLFRAGEPVELVLAVPDGIGAAAEALCAVLGDLIEGIDDPADIVVCGHSEAGTMPHDLTLVPSGDPVCDGAVLGEAVAHLYAVRARLDQRAGRPVAIVPAGPPPDSPDPCLVARLARAAIRPGSKTSEPSPGRTYRGPYGVYVGNDRVLVATNWGGATSWESKLLVSASDLSIAPDLIARGFYDLPLTNYLVATLHPDQVVFDVGANVGFFTVLMAFLVGPAGRVVAYEAAPANFALLRDNLAMNYLNEWVVAVPKAAAATAGIMPFSATTRFTGNGSLIRHDETYFDFYRVDSTVSFDVEAEPLDVQSGHYESIDLVKIDVEGGEYQVFLGMTELLRRGVVRTVVFELLRSRMANDWVPFADLLSRYEQEGWSFATLAEDGSVVPARLQDVLAHGRWSQVLMQRGA